MEPIAEQAIGASFASKGKVKAINVDVALGGERGHTVCECEESAIVRTGRAFLEDTTREYG